MTKVSSREQRYNRVRRIRAKVSGTAQRPRIAIYRSLTHISVQAIDDTVGRTIVSASDRGLAGTPTEKAQQVGQQLAEALVAKNIKTVVFDRAGFRYHGRVAALAEGARQAGLMF